ncbi:MAG: tRNA pseudouridine(38-40) synthase TruA [bacterium]|nr:tRNA pseudouridine(38-40) synthase TruA [bacterium]
MEIIGWDVEAGMRVIHMTVAYDGSEFHGWQEQRGLRTVQGVLREVVERVLGECRELRAASRTDAGVHARGQSVQFYTERTLECERIARGLNRYLPADVAVVRCEEAPPDFSVRCNRGKHYRYEMWLAEYDDPLERRYHWWYRYPLDVTAMAAAGREMVGTHEMNGLRMVSGKAREETVRTVDAVTVTAALPRLTIDIVGKSFMYKQVRAMVGVLVAVGRGRIAVSSVRDVIAGQAGPRRFEVAPAHGLTLMEVLY